MIIKYFFDINQYKFRCSPPFFFCVSAEILIFAQF